MFRKARVILLVLLASAMPAGTARAQPAPQPKLAPLLNEDAKDRIPGQYIVVFKRGTPREVVAAAQSTARKHDGKILHVYTSSLIGFSAKLPPKAVEALRAAPGVAYIEADRTGHTQTIQPPNPPGNPPTGLDRIDRRLLPLNNTYTYSETGNGVHAYILDTGIRVTNTEFGMRASGAFNAVVDGKTADTDCNGHGTNVAGIVGATTYGVAKQVTLHSVRVAQCSGSVAGADAIAGVDWVTANATAPAVANMSIAFGAFTSLDTAVGNSIAAGVTYAIAAGNASADACNTSPARVAAAITVGAIDPANDTRAGFSNFGTCVDLFAPGVNILSAGNASDTATSTFSGTSQATPHVAGVAARHLETHPAATPAAVWTAIHNADDVTGTAGWAGITDPGTGSPNELLHWGSLNDGANDGDPHLTTVDGVHYDFQSAGEFVSLRDGNGLEIQTRQTPIATTFNPGANPYTGLATCVSLNSAVAARVGTRRVTYQPNISGVPDPSGLQLRVDGVLTPLPASGIDLGDDGRVAKAAGGGIEVHFPDDTVLYATPGWWASQDKWYLNVHVYHTRATQGILGSLAPNSWLPALSDGSSLGPKPGALHQRYVDLYQKFADSWRVTDQTSLFDYAPGTSTATFTLGSWPMENPPCVIPQVRPVEPVSLDVARNACREIAGKNMHADCVFDVRVTGEPGFAKTYVTSQRIERGSTTVTVTDDMDPTQPGEWITFTATVMRNASSGRGVPAGTVQFMLDGAKVGQPIPLDSKARATWGTSRLKVGMHRVAASYTPGKDSVFFASRSGNEEHTVQRCFCEPAEGDK